MESIQRKIAEVEDIADVIALMVNLNIETKGCKTPIEQMQDRICLDHLQRRLVTDLAELSSTQK